MTREALGALLAAVNAGLNSLSAVLLLVGYAAITREPRDVKTHKRCMLGAFVVSGVFLLCYLLRVALTGTHRFPGDGLARSVYLTVLFSHMALAAVTPVLSIRAIYLALRGRYEEHRRVVRYGWPIWMYVSVTGVVVYLMLYHYPRG